MPAPDRADPDHPGHNDPEPGDPEPGDLGVGGELVLVQPAVPASLRPIRRSVRRWLDGAGWPLVAAEDIELAVNEAVANSIDHAYLDDDPGPIHLHAWITCTTTSPVTPAVTTPPGTAPVVTMGVAVAAVPRPVVAVVAAPGFPAAAIAFPGFLPPDPPDPAELADPAKPAEPAPGVSRRVATIAVSDRGRWSRERRTIDPSGHRGHGLTVMTAVMAAVHLQRSARGTMVVLVSHPAPT